MGSILSQQAGARAGPPPRGQAKGPRPLAVRGPSLQSVRLGVGLGDLGRDTAAVGDRVAVGPCPLADLRGVAASTAGAAAATSGGPAATRAPRVTHPRCEGLAQLARILRGEVDLVRSEEHTSELQSRG